MPVRSPGLPFDAILFDLGSTLIYSEANFPELIDEMDRKTVQSLIGAGLPIDPEAFIQTFRQPMNAYQEERGSEFLEVTTAYQIQNTLAALGAPPVSEGILKKVLADRYALSQAYWKAELDAEPVLEELKQRGYRLGIVSNAGDDQDVQTLIDHAGIRNFFDVILSSAAQGIRKPNPRIFLTALDALGVSPERAVMVGDTLGADILGAHNAGMVAIWITRRADKAANRAHEETIHPEAVIETLSELPALLDNFQ